ncbi:MAG: hypothetical protein LDL53_10460 [Candidatus Hydrogenedens sp.]|nr:hypothetical protein [Candidatus Hydrogenedens sp.]
MEEMNQINCEEKEVYEKPIFEEVKAMSFPEEICEEIFNSPWCFGCTNCSCSCY